MPSLLEIKPKNRRLVIDLVREAGLDVSDWGRFKGGQAKAASNPKYCYEWSYVQGDLVILNLWFEEIVLEDGKIIRHINLRKKARRQAKHVWKSRGGKADDAIQTAYRLQLPIRAIICDGLVRKSDDETAKPSRVDNRMLDPVPWAVISYDGDSGECVLGRGSAPIPPNDTFDADDDNYEGFEGELKRRFILHRKRERRLRDLKIREALRRNDGHLLCEVPNCGFDFFEVYGALGEGYAEVHHNHPLSNAPDKGKITTLDDLAVVCSNCHSMIHRHGNCRKIESLIPKARAKIVPIRRSKKH